MFTLQADFPYLRNQSNVMNNLPKLLDQLHVEIVQKLTSNPQYDVIFWINNDDTSLITRIFQEHEILSTKISLPNGKVMQSFWDAWKVSIALRNRIQSSLQPQEDIWNLARQYKYKIPTTFMPSYAKAIYEHFSMLSSTKVVLDPCAGWGDRFLAASCTPHVQKYIGFDPNLRLQPGHIEIAQCCGNSVKNIDANSVAFENGSVIYNMPFEKGALLLQDNSVDFVFTSPPFFDYEIYNQETNPTYLDWINEFYVPLFHHMCRICKDGHYIALYVSDTSSGKIDNFIATNIEHLCPLRIKKQIGFVGIMSEKIRTIWVFQKNACVFKDPEARL